MKAKAAVLFGVGKELEIQAVDVQPPGVGEVLIRMVAAGICRSDLHVMTGQLNAPLPAILGHEGSGIVEEVGPEVRSIRPGDHVIPLWRLSCGECEYCYNSRPALCSHGTEIRKTGRLLDGSSRFKLDGKEIKHFAGVSSFAEYSVVPEKSVVKLPQDFPLEKAALLGCAVISGFGAVINTAQVTVGSTVAVFGTGGVGMNVIQGAAAAGAETIIAVDLLDNKLKLAHQFGATHMINASKGDPVETIREISRGRGVDYAFEVIGRPTTIRQAFDSLAKRGMAVVVGTTASETEVSIPVMALTFEERKLTGSLYGSSKPKIDISKIINLYRRGILKLDELLTRTYPFEQINEAFAALEQGEVIRSIVKI